MDRLPQCQRLSHSGGGSGIGRAVCQRLASEGASVVVADLNEASADETLQSLPGDLRGQAHMATAADVASKDSVKTLLTSIQVCPSFYILDPQIGQNQLKKSADK